MRTVLAMAMAMMVTAGMAAADDKAMTPPAVKPAKREAAKKPKASKLMGVVTAVDAAAGKLSIKTKKGGAKDFAVAADARIMRGATKATLAEVAVNDEVTVGIETLGDVVTVRRVKVRVAPAAKKTDKK